MKKTYYTCPIPDEPVHEVVPRAGDFAEFNLPSMPFIRSIYS